MNVKENQVVPVITIDGPTASGKGTVADLVAQHLGWHRLDSGALYRLTALSCLQNNIDVTCAAAVAKQAQHMEIRFHNGQSWLDDIDVTEVLRQEQVGVLASKIAVYPEVRQALLQRQHDFRQSPGLVTDGRDMGTVIFPDAALKIFLVADVQSRAQRRYKQLIAKGISANLSNLLADLQARDLRDSMRQAAPLIAADDAYTLDSTALTIEQTVDKVLKYWAEKQNF